MSPAGHDALTRFGDGYRDWLMDSFGFAGEWEWLFGELMETEFTWTIEEDARRAVDGIYMRDRYSYETGARLPEGWREWPCSVLEFLAAIAVTMEESFLYDPDSRTGYSDWMWEMLGNLGLDSGIFSDERVNPPLAAKRVRTILRRFLERKFEYSGRGGIFPLRRPSRDQRDVEYWFQLNEYVMEKRPF